MSHCKISDDENLLSGSCKENKYMQMPIEMKHIKMNILHLYSYSGQNSQLQTAHTEHEDEGGNPQQPA